MFLNTLKKIASSTVFHIILCSALAAVLCAVIVSKSVSAKKNDPPESSAGQEGGEPDTAKADSGAELNIEEKWLGEHKDPSDPIDLAIFRLAELTDKYRADDPYSRLYSSASPRRSRAIVEASREIPASSYPALWERACTEPAFRPFKLVALERFLGIELTEYGLYDALAQHMWYEDFTAMKNSLPEGEFTAADMAKYGNLLLPALYEKAKSDTLTPGEASLLTEQINARFDEKLTTVGEAVSWMEENAPVLDAIRSIIASDHEWAE